MAGSYDLIEPLKIDFKDGQGDVKDKQPELDDGYSLQGVLYYDLSSAQSVHFTLGKKNNLPTLKQRYSSLWGAQIKSPGLDIENAINYELGYDLALGSTNLSVAVFYNDMKNMFVQKTLIQTTDENAAKAVCAVPSKSKGKYSCYQNVNADSGYTWGGEVGVEQGFFADDMLILGANYSFIQKRAKGVGLEAYGSSDGKKILDYPNHIANAKIIIKPINSLQFIALSTLESARYYEDGNGGYDKGANYFTLDLSANYELGKGLSVNAGVLNLTDRDNFSGVIGQSYHFAGRQWFAGFEYKY